MPRWMHSGWLAAAVLITFLATAFVPITCMWIQRERKANSSSDVTVLSGQGLVEFIDHPERFSGKTLRAELKIGAAIFADRGDSLRNYSNRVVEFGAFGPKGEKITLHIKMPNNNDIPNAAYNDSVLVTFVCRNGNLFHGNEATSVSRP